MTERDGQPAMQRVTLGRATLATMTGDQQREAILKKRPLSALDGKRR